MSESIATSSNKLEDILLDMIVCPVDKQPLTYSFIETIEEPVLANLRTKKYYEVKDSIPILLEEESKDISESALAAIQKNAIRTTGSFSS